MGGNEIQSLNALILLFPFVWLHESAIFRVVFFFVQLSPNICYSKASQARGVSHTA